jgi:hypothetical protein
VPNRNTPPQVIKYFRTDTTKRMNFREAADFWQSLTDKEKDYFLNVNLETGLPCLEEK